VQYLERAVALDPEFMAAWDLLARARSWLLRSGVGFDTLPAWTAVERTRALAPGSLEAALAAGYYRYYARGDFTAALAEMEAADRLMPNSSEILVARALLERRLGRFDESLALTLRAAELDPRNVDALEELAGNYKYMGRADEAELWYERALRLRPTSASLILGKFRLLVNVRGDIARARQLTATARGLIEPEQAANLDGTVAFLARDYAAAAAGYSGLDRTEVNTLVPNRSLALALVARAAGDSQAMRAHADTLLRITRAELASRMRRGADDPFGSQATVESELAVGLALLGEHAGAARTVEGALRKYPIERDAVDSPFNLRWMAIVYMIAGRKAEAVTTLERALAIPSDDLTVPMLRLDPTFDPLRTEPGFQRLVSGSPSSTP
jgi:tetratricopeptide (TPR) repeat protein